jgi:hypothetical protein
MSRQVAANVSVGIHNARTLPGTLPIERLVEELNRFGPNHMNAFPSVAAILADEQISGRLCISLTTVMNCAPFSQANRLRRAARMFAGTDKGREK